MIILCERFLMSFCSGFFLLRPCSVLFLIITVCVCVIELVLLVGFVHCLISKLVVLVVSVQLVVLAELFVLV